MEKFINIGISFVAVILAGIPTYIYLLARTIASPEGFWQEVVLAGLGVWLLGGIQILLILLLIGFLLWLWFSDE